MKKILIVDDQFQIRQLVSWALEESGYELKEASTGEAALRMALENRPDLILLDVSMPGRLDGFQTCVEIRRHGVLKGIRIVLLTAHDRQEDREKGIAAGANAYLVKPFKPAQLRGVIQKLLEPPTAPTSSAASAGESAPVNPPA